MTLDLKELEAVCKLVQKYMINSITLPNGITISKTVHTPPVSKATPRNYLLPPTINGWDVPNPDSDTMFFVNDAPKLPLEELDQFASNPPSDNGSEE